MSPFVSQKQAAWMFSNKPEMAAEWAAHTPSIKKLPTRKRKKSKIKLKIKYAKN